MAISHAGMSVEINNQNKIFKLIYIISLQGLKNLRIGTEIKIKEQFK